MNRGKYLQTGYVIMHAYENDTPQVAHHFGGVITKASLLRR